MKKALKKALFIDRDGTLIVEPPVDMQVDSLAKLEFVPGAISALKVLRGLDFELVMATNQDGLGTDSFPEEDFRIPQEKMLRTLAGEGVLFDDMLIDRTFESDGAPTRKPRTGMFGRYTGGGYDLAASYVVGDRATDILLARNLGARGNSVRTGDGGPPDAARSRSGRALRADQRFVVRDRRVHPPRRTAGGRNARDPRNADHRPARPRRQRVRRRFARPSGRRNRRRSGERRGYEKPG